MNKWKSATILTVLIIISACKHKPESPPACVAGSGGNVTVVAYATYNGISIPNYFTHLDTAFVKFGTTSSPGTKPANYDIYFVSEPGEDHIHCMGLKCGDYFIYRTAWDSIANVMRYGGYGIRFSETNGDTIINVVVN